MARVPTWIRERGAAWTASVVGLALLCAYSVYERYTFIFEKCEPRKYTWSDMGGYIERAVKVAMPGAQYNRFDTFYPPGTHLIMAPAFKLAGGNQELGLLYNQYLWWFFAVAALWGVAALGWKLFRHPLAGLVAMALLMTHWPYGIFAGLYMSENPFNFFMAWSLFLGLVARDVDEERPVPRIALFVAAGLLAGIGTVVRPQYVLGAATIGFPLLTRRFPFAKLRFAVPLAVAFLLPVGAGVAWQSHAAGEFQGLSSNAGFNFYQGHCDIVHVETHQAGLAGYYQFAAPIQIQRAQREGREEKKAVHWDHMAWDNAYFFAEGWKCIRKDGWSHWRRIIDNVEDFFSSADPWPPNITPFQRGSTWGNHVYSHALLFLVPAAILLALFRRPERWLLLQLATVISLGFVFYGDSRYRIPYDMFGFLIVGGIITAITGLRRDARRIPGVGWRERLPGP